MPNVEAFITRDRNGNAEILQVALERDAVEAVSKIIRKHEADFRAALEPLGVEWLHVLQPTWMRAMTQRDLDTLQKIGGDEHDRKTAE